MNYQAAKNLHNEDEVILKATGDVLRVLNVQVNPVSKVVMIETCNGPDGWCIYHHTEVL